MTKLLTPAVVAVLLEVNPKTLSTWVYRGLIPFVRIADRTIRFDEAELRAWIEQSRNKQPTKKQRKLSLVAGTEAGETKRAG